MAIKIELFEDLYAEPVLLLAQNNYFYPKEIRNKFFGDLTDNISYGRVLFIDDKLVGWACWSENTSKKADKNKCHLDYILIDNDYDRKGYGTLLLEEFIKWSRENGKTQLSANVVDGYIRAENFYTKNGFKKKHRQFLYNQWVKCIRNRKSKN